MYDKNIQSTLYTLKKDFGVRAYLTFKIQDPSYNLLTGDESNNLDQIQINKAIQLPMNISVLNHLVNVDPNFKYGGDYEINSKQFIIDRKDLRKSDGTFKEITTDDWMIVETNDGSFIRFNIIRIPESYLKTATYFIGKQSEGEVRNMVCSRPIKDKLIFSDQINGVL